MTSPCAKLLLDDTARTYRPGEVLAGQFSLEGVASDDVRACELSVLWHTEGKGDEDLSVHFFERLEPHNGESIDFRQPRRFSTELPNSPLTYGGQIVKIAWCVRVRFFLNRGKELSLEIPFQLGAVPHPEPLKA
jgi:hypothetical protein